MSIWKFNRRSFESAATSQTTSRRILSCIRIHERRSHAARSTSHKLYKNLIGGEWVPSRSGKTFLNINPARHDDIVGEFQASAAEDVDDCRCRRR